MAQATGKIRGLGRSVASDETWPGWKTKPPPWRVKSLATPRIGYTFLLQLDGYPPTYIV